MDDGIRGGKLRGACPAAVLDAEDVKRKRRRADGNDAILADDAILLAAADEFAGKKQKRAAAAIDQNELVDRSAGVVLRKIDGTAVARALQDLRALLGDSHFAGRETFLERKKRTGVLTLGADDREDGDVFVDDGVEQSPFALWPGRKGRR